jgi:hypothetical protein
MNFRAVLSLLFSLCAACRLRCARTLWRFCFLVMQEWMLEVVWSMAGRTRDVCAASPPVFLAISPQ